MFNVSGVTCGRRLEDQHFSFLVGDGTVLDAVRHDHEFPGTNLNGSVAKFDAAAAANPEKELIFPLVVVPPGRIWIVVTGTAMSWAQHDPEQTVEVLDMPVSSENEAILSEAQDLQKGLIVEGFRSFQRTNRKIDVIDTYDLGFHPPVSG